MLLSNDVSMMSRSKRILVIVGIAIVYLVTARLGLLLAVENGVVTAVWPPSGVALAGLLIFGRGVWPGIWIGSFAANLWSFLEQSPAPNSVTAVLVSTLFGMGASGAAWFSAWALTQFSDTKKITGVREVGMFLLYGGLLGCLISSINGATTLCLSGLSPVSAWRGIWLTWWMGDALGVLLFTPFLTAWIRSGEKFKLERPIEAIACMTLLITIALYVYTSRTSSLFGGLPNDIILLPALAWVGLRLGYRGITLALVLTCLIAVWGTTNGHGPYVRPTLNQSLVSLDLALLCLIATGLSIVAVVQQWKDTKSELAAANLHLEERVVQRTRELLITTEELRATAVEQTRASDALRIHTRLSQDLNRAMTISEASRLITNTAEELIGWDATLLIMLDSTTGLCRSVLAIDLVDGIKRDVLSAFDDKVPSARFLRTIEHGAELILRKTSDEFVANLTTFGNTARRSASMMFVPVRDEHKVVGMLSIQSYKSNAYTQSNLDTLQSLADQCAGALSRIQSREQLRQSSDQMIEAQKIAHLGNFVWNARTDQLTWSDELYRIQGIEPGSARLSMEFCLGTVHEADRPRVRAAFHAVMTQSTPLREDYRVRYSDGSIHWLHARARTFFDEQGKITGMEGTCLDITELKRQERFTEEHRAVLEKIARGEPLKVTLTALVHAIENHSSEMLCSLMLMAEDGKHLNSFVGPRLPAEYTAAVDGVEIGPEAGSCGTAAFLKKPVIVTDVVTDPLWRRFHPYATKHGLRACWSTPILDSQERVLATFAMYQRTCSAPTVEQKYIITIATQTAAIAIIRHREEQALRQSEERLQVSIEAANIGSWDWDLKTNRVNFSPQWKAHLGFKPEELEDTYNTWSDRLHPDDKDRTLATVNAYLRGVIPNYEIEFRLRHKDDSYRWIQTKGRTLSDGSNTPSRIVGCNVDITERKRFESEQARSFSLLQAAIESSNEGLLVVDLTGKVTLFNQQFIKFWNIPAEILATRDDATLLDYVLSSIKKPDVFLAGVKKLYGHPDLESFDLIELKDGRYCERYSQPQRLGEDIVGRVWSFRDITARKTAVDQIQRVNTRLEKLSKRLIEVQETERRHLARELHDELGQTLTATKILLQTATAKADMALEGIRINPPQSDHQKLIQNAITHTDHMLKMVRNLSLNLRPPMLDDFGLVSALRWLVDQHVRTTNRAVEFESEHFEERYSSAIETACFRVAQEALTNVSRYSQATKVTVNLKRDQENLCLIIRDNGIGFDVEAAIKRTKEGDTLGLSNLRERALLIGGNLEFISKPGEGTEVRALFPIEELIAITTT